MPRKTLVVCILTLLLVSVVSVFGQFEKKVDDMLGKKVILPENTSTNDMQSQLSSVVVAPTTPVFYQGFSTGFNVMGACATWDDKADPKCQATLCTSNAAIRWYGPVPTMSNFNTLTITISSLPPGPCGIGLGNATTVYANYINLDSTVMVLDPVNYPQFFQSTTTLTSVWFKQLESWTTAASWGSSASDCPPTNLLSGYPTMQWAPESVTLVYQ